MLVAVGRSPCVVNTTVSFASEALPDALDAAPPVADEFSQPRPGPLGGFEQGQAITPARPGSQKLVKLGDPSMRARVRYQPAAMSTNATPAGSTGTSHWPQVSSPHATTEPSLRRATVWPPLPNTGAAAASSTYVRPAGSAGTLH